MVERNLTNLVVRQFGAGPGQGAGHGCNTCYQLTITTDTNHKAVTQKSIKVTVNNLCPIDGNPICNVPTQDADIHFDLCMDTGAGAAFFTSTQSGLGTAVQVAC